MTKKIVKPATKAATTKAAVAAPTAEKPTSPAAVISPVTVPTPAAVPAPTVSPEPKKIDMNKQSIKEAIANGKSLIKEGKSKADAAMAIFEALKDEEKEVVIAAFVQGATLTEKGSVTYWYNCKRKARKAAAKSA